MEQFKITADGFKEIRKGMLMRSGPILLVAVVAGIGISVFNSNAKPYDWSLLLFEIPLFIAIVCFSLYRGINLQKAIYSSYTLTLDDHQITRAQFNTQTITIANEAISEIIKNKNGNLLIKGKSKVDVIKVSSQIENYEHLLNLLNERKPLATVTHKSFIEKYSLLVSLAAMLVMATTYISENKIIVAVCGTITIALLGYSYFEIKRNKNLDDKTRKGAWVFFMVIISIAMTVYFKLAL